MAMDDKKLEQLLRQALPQGQEKPPQLDGVVKAAVWQRQEQLRAAPCRVSVWYLPMVLNAVFLGLSALGARVLLGGVAGGLVALGCLWGVLGGVAMTFVGLRFADLKEKLSIELPAKGKKEVG